LDLAIILASAVIFIVMRIDHHLFWSFSLIVLRTTRNDQLDDFSERVFVGLLKDSSLIFDDFA
jgi:hypothetical protein